MVGLAMQALWAGAPGGEWIWRHRNPRRPVMPVGSTTTLFPGVTGDWSLVLCFPGQLGEKQVPSPTSDDRVKDEFSDLSEG